MRLRAESISLTRRLAQRWSARRARKTHKRKRKRERTLDPKMSAILDSRPSRTILNASRCSRMPARDHLAEERVTRLKPVKLTRAKRISLPPYPNAKFPRNNRKEVDRPMNQTNVHYHCVQRRHGSKDRAKRRLGSVEANIVRSTCLVAGI